MTKDLVRAVGGAAASSSASAAPAAELREGDKVEGNYRGRGKWYPGKISRVRLNGTYDVDYDDGEKETGVQKVDVRVLNGRESSHLVPELRRGDRVEAIPRHERSWFAGDVLRVDRDTVEVEFDSREFGRQEVVVADVRILDRRNDPKFSRDSRSDRDEIAPRRARSPEDYRGKSEQKEDHNDVRRDRDERDTPRRRSRSRSPPGELKSLLSRQIVEDLRSLAQRYASSSADTTLYKKFSEFDDETEPGKHAPAGRISKKEFKNALRAIFSHVNKQELRSSRMSSQSRNQLPSEFEDWLSERDFGILADALAYPHKGKGSSGSVAYNEFASFVLGGSKTAKGAIGAESEIVMECHMKLVKEGLERNKLLPRDVLKLFNSSRSFSNGYVKSSEFEKVLKRISSKLSSGDLEELIKRFDTSDEGTVDYYLFITWLYSGFDVTTRSASTLQVKFAHQLSMLEAKSVQRACEDAAGRHEDLSLSAFQDFCESLGLILSGCERALLFAALDSASKGKVPVSAIVSIRSEGADALSGKNKFSKKGSGVKLDDKDVLISTALRADIAQAVSTFLDRNSTAKTPKSLGRIVHDFIESAGDKRGSSTLSRKPFRRLFRDGLSLQLKEDEENILFECLDYESTGSVQADNLILFLYALAYDNDSMEVCPILQGVLTGSGTATPKELSRTLAKYDALNNGLVDDKSLEKALKKVSSGGSGSFGSALGRFSRGVKEPASNALSEDNVADLKNYLDPSRSGLIDRYYAHAIAAVCMDCATPTEEIANGNTKVAELKLKGCFRIMRLRGIDYKGTFEDVSKDSRVDMVEDEKDGKSVAMLSMEDCVDLFEVSIGAPLLRCELYSVIKLLQRSGRVPVDALLERMDSENVVVKKEKDGSSGSVEEADSFGKTLWKKICKIRASRRGDGASLRKAFLEADKDGQGRISKRDLQRLLDKHTDLTDPEAALLEENLELFDAKSSAHASLRASTAAASSANYVDYPLMLLMLHEPLQESTAVVAAGASLMTKMTRSGGDSLESLRRLLQLLYRNFASSDHEQTGFITVEAAEQVIQQECPTADSASMDLVLVAFQDSQSDCILYPELWAYLSCCLKICVVNRIAELDTLRQKQGYNLVEFLMKLSRKSKIDASRFTDQMVGLGILLPETAVCIIFSHFCIDKKTNKGYLDMEAFADALTGAGDAGAEAGKLRRRDANDRQELQAYSSNGGTDDIASAILSEYDVKLSRAMQIAFDMFDTDNSNTIKEDDLERIMDALSYDCDYTDLEDLLSKIDRGNTGILEYNNFMTHAMAFCRDRYKQTLEPTKKSMHVFFRNMDRDGDENITHSEFAHVSNSSNFKLTTEEMNELIDYLDIDKSGTVSWDEFKRLLHMFDNEQKMLSLPRTMRSACRKIQYGHLPNPRKYLMMHAGLPKCYRRSVLANIAKDPKNSVSNVLSAPAPIFRLEEQTNKKAANGVPGPQKEVEFEISVTKVEGVPSENAERSADVVHRGLRFCIVQTDKAPTPDEPGHPPRFLSNVSKMHALTDSAKSDMWLFDSPDSLNSDLANFVKASAEEGYFYEDPADKNSARIKANSPGSIDQLYVFIELVVTVKVEQNVTLGRKGPVVSSKSSTKQRDKAKEEPANSTQGTMKLGEFLGLRGKPDQSQELSKSRRLTRGRSRDMESTDKARESDAPESPVRSPAREAEASELDDNANVDNASDAPDASTPTVELTCAWCMVPISYALMQSVNGKPVNLKLEMFGGSPFGILPLDKIKKRPGVFSAVRRLLGFKVKPTISLSLRPLPSAEAVKVDTKDSENSILPRALFALLPANVVLPRSAVLMAGVYRQLLRKELAERVTAYEDVALPQTGPTKSQNVLLSAFPDIIGDDAVIRVLMYLWALDAPPSLFKKNLHQITSNDLMQDKIISSFRGVVLRIWRAYNSPDARPNPLLPIESAQVVSAREENVLNMVGLKIKFGMLFPASVDLNAATLRNATAADFTRMGAIDIKALAVREDAQPGILKLIPISNHLYSPFSTQELVNNAYERVEF